MGCFDYGRAKDEVGADVSNCLLDRRGIYPCKRIGRGEELLRSSEKIQPRVESDDVWGGPTSSDSPRAKLRWIPMVSRALGDLG